MQPWRLVSWNVNGIRAIAKKGFWQWFQQEDAAVVCLQEIKAKPDQLSEATRCPPGYHASWHAADKPGYSGLVTYSKEPPISVQEGLGQARFDSEARVLVTEFAKLIVVNAYFPHSRRDLSRLDFKMAFCEAFQHQCERWQLMGKPLIICGDYNTAHREIDLTNFKANRKNAGFLPVERAWMDHFLSSGFRDVFRDAHPERKSYTWWSQRKGVRERNVGWRIDYVCVSDALAGQVTAADHHTKIMGSDHCPIYVDLAVA